MKGLRKFSGGLDLNSVKSKQIEALCTLTNPNIWSFWKHDGVGAWRENKLMGINWSNAYN